MSANASPTSEVRAGPREWLGLAVLILPVVVLSSDATVLYLALPHLSADLAPSSTQQLWILDIYGFMIAGMLITMGTLGDRIGHRKLLMIGAAAFGITALIAAYSVNSEMLMVSRALMGVAGAMLSPVSLALISGMFQNPAQRARAIGLWMSAFMGGAVLGPVFGGVLLQSFWWGSVFLIDVPIMALVLVVAPLLLPRDRELTRTPLDLVSVLLSLGALLPVVYGLKELSIHGLTTMPLLAIAVGVLFGVLFVRRQLRLEEPLMDLRLFRIRTFSVSLAAMGLGIMAMSAFLLFVTQYLQVVADLSPLEAGLWMVPAAVMMIVGSMYAPTAAKYIRPAFVIAGGLVIAAIGGLLLTQAGTGGELTPMVLGWTFIGFGSTPLMALLIDRIVSSAPPERAGLASSMSETGGELGGALGIVTLGSIGTAVYRSRISDELPADLSAEQTQAAQGTLAGAAEVSRDPAVGDGLLTQAQEAFVAGMHTAAVASAVFLLLLAVAVVLLLRHLQPIRDEPEAEPEELADDAVAEPAHGPATASDGR